MQLRRAPKVDENSFIFDNLIDYKSFEFLSKLYKISEKLIDFDDDSIIMNMWFKLIEGKLQNFEILAKFLVHNISSFLIKLKNNKNGNKDDITSKPGKRLAKFKDKFKIDNKSSKESEYCLEFEKQKRYSMSIFNYIKARTMQSDLRNSINLSAGSITWS